MVRIDISKACMDLQRRIVSMFAADEAGAIVVQGDIKQVKKELELKLPEDYIVAENAEDPDELAVLKRGDLEQFDMYLCNFCAMVFRSDIERNIHQRVHYFGFG